MKHVTAWRPDTCECEVLYEWDADLPIDARDHVAVAQVTDSAGQPRIARRCAVHAAANDHQAHFAIVLAENQLKNRVLRAAGEAAGLSPHEMSWWLDAARVPHVTFLTTPAGNRLEAARAAVRQVHPDSGVME